MAQCDLTTTAVSKVGLKQYTAWRERESHVRLWRNFFLCERANEKVCQEAELV